MRLNEGDTFDALLRGYRERAGLTQRQLADLSALSERAIRNLENGRARRPRQDTVQLLADGLRLGRAQRRALEVACGRIPQNGTSSARVAETPLSPPAPIDSLIGREPELHSLVDLLSTAGQRWITAVGLGGVGKTQLALEAVTRLHMLHNTSVLWVMMPGADRGRSLSPMPARVRELLLRPNFVAEEVAETIGPLDTVLVLDGQDEVRVAADRIHSLLHLSPHLRVLATARAPYHSPGECVFPLSPLALPTRADEADPQRLKEVPAVRLLLLFFRQVRPDFQLGQGDTAAVAALCRLLDGVPAAMQTAARWALMHTPDQLLARLRTDPFGLVNTSDLSPVRFDIHDSVRSALARLGPAKQFLLAKLARQQNWSVPEAATMVNRSVSETARGVYKLILHGLVRRSEDDGSRYTMLNLVRMTQLSLAQLTQALPNGSHQFANVG